VRLFKAAAPYDNDIEQFSSGFATTFKLGVCFYTDYQETRVSISAYFKLPHYNYFNSNFVSASGELPYADITAKIYGAGLSIQIEV